MWANKRPGAYTESAIRHIQQSRIGRITVLLHRQLFKNSSVHAYTFVWSVFYEFGKVPTT